VAGSHALRSFRRKMMIETAFLAALSKAILLAILAGSTPKK
jgi:hypothetical protein